MTIEMTTDSFSEAAGFRAIHAAIENHDEVQQRVDGKGIYM